ncbi:hypothetical protein ABS71_18480 [bacterium SCN 62-11]|nr:MAG: hypothetical protein ABS71_18480 [bacterium SCN 62-11]
MAISVWLNLRPAKGGRPAIFYHLVALAVQLVLLRESSFYDWGAGPIALLILLGGLWRARPEPLATSSIPGLTRVPG